MGCVYYIFHKESGKGYVGKTIRPTPDGRIWAHSHQKSISLIGQALKKYGLTAFKVVILYTSENEMDLFKYEVYFIDLLETSVPSGYNVDFGGLGGHSGKKSPFSEEHKKAISISLKGKEFSEEHKKAISVAKKNSSLSEEHKKRISLSLRALPIGMKGRKPWYYKYLTGEKRQ